MDILSTYIDFEPSFERTAGLPGRIRSPVGETQRRQVDSPATIYVERESQKGIVIGRAGRALKKLGVDARRKIEELIAQRVYLELRVKVLELWSRKRGHLKQLGFRLPRPRNSGQDGP